MWGGSIKIGARHFWGRGVFVLGISNINIGFQKLLTLPLTVTKLFSTHSQTDNLLEHHYSPAESTTERSLYVIRLYHGKLIRV